MQYEALFFDFDGVLADSVEVKTEAFAKLYEPYGPEVVTLVIAHHRRHSGMTRTEKFLHYHRDYLGKTLSDDEMAELCQQFSELVVDKVVGAREIRGAGEFLRKWCSQLPCFVISATPQEEIRQIVLRRGMMGYFKAVLGAPASKKDNLQRLLNQFHLNPSKCCLFGDAESDYRAAHACGVEFIGIVNYPSSPLIRARPEIRYTKDFTDVASKFGLTLELCD
jgi:beta-phosphoglucomutase-like phosphatase (HAD superfamily)